LGFAASCVPTRGGWDVAALAVRHPQLQAIPGQRLGDLAPFFWLEGEELVSFACRWSSARPVPVWLEPAAKARWQPIVERALSSLEGAVPGLRFAPLATSADDRSWQEREGITIELLGGAAESTQSTEWTESTERPLGSGDAVADCRIGSLHGPAQLDATLQRASVRVASVQADALGRPTPLSEVEVFAALLHELAHALGFAGHVGAGDSPLRLASGDVRRVGRRAWRGEPLDWPTLRALYAVPSGAILARSSVAPETARLARLLGVAVAAGGSGFEGPFARSGERSAEIFWRIAGVRYLLWARRGSWPDDFELRPNAAAVSLLTRVAAD
jgi:hypothetical protein